MMKQKSVVTSVEANGAFIHVWMQDCLESVELLHSRILSHIGNLTPVNTKSVKAGVTLLAQAADLHYYRVRVIRPNFESENNFRCFFVDYGSFETVPLDKLFNLPADTSLIAIPQLARCYMLDGIVAKTSDMWPDNMMAALSNRLVDREFAVELLGQCGPYPVVRLSDPINNTNITEFLTNTGLGRRESAYGRWISYIPQNPKLVSGTKLVVQIVDGESASDFSVTVDPSLMEIDLKTILTATAKAVKTPITVQIMPHMLCLARCESMNDGVSFFRAEVIAVDASAGVQVRLLDVGKKIVVPPSSLFAMTPELLRLPPLALHMCLGGLELSSDDHIAASQLEWLRELSYMQTPVSVTILHCLSPNFYAVAINEVGLLTTTPLPYRLLPVLGQRPFDVYLNRSLAQCSFNEPMLPAVLSSSLASFDSLMAAFLSYLTFNDLQRLPTSAVRAGVFCVAYDSSDRDQGVYPIRCVILSPIMGPQMRCLIYEIDTGRQTVRPIDHVYCAPAFAFAHPSFCVPVIAFDAEGKSASARVVATKVRAIHREPVGTQAGIVVVQEVMMHPTTYDNAGRILHPVIEEVIIDDSIDTASESTGYQDNCMASEYALEEISPVEDDRLINLGEHETNHKESSDEDSQPITMRPFDSDSANESAPEAPLSKPDIIATATNCDVESAAHDIDSSNIDVDELSGDNGRLKDALSFASSALTVAIENKEFEEDFTAYTSPDVKMAPIEKSFEPAPSGEMSETTFTDNPVEFAEEGQADAEQDDEDMPALDLHVGSVVEVNDVVTEVDQPAPTEFQETEWKSDAESADEMAVESGAPHLLASLPGDDGFVDDVQREEVVEEASTEKQPVFSFVVDEDSDLPSESAKKEKPSDEDQPPMNALNVNRRGSLVEWQYSVPPRSLSVNAEANQQLSPSCPFSIVITPASRLNSFDPSAAAATDADSDIHAHLIAHSDTVIETVIVDSLGNNEEELGDSTDKRGEDETGTPPPSARNDAVNDLSDMFYAYPKALIPGPHVVNISYIPEDVMQSKQFWITPIHDPYDTIRSNYITTYLIECADRLAPAESVFPKEMITPGFCCVSTTELNEGTPFRVEVLELLGSDRSLAKVLFVDYGHCGVCDVSRFKICPPEILSIPRLAHLCSSDNAEVLFTLRVNERRRIVVDSYDEQSHIHRVKIALPSIDDLQPAQRTEFIEADQLYEITLVESPRQVYVRIPALTSDFQEDAKFYEAMFTQLQSESCHGPKIATIDDFRGDRCLVLAQGEDSIWKRALVLAVEPENWTAYRALLHFIDFGGIESVAGDKIRRLSMERPFDAPPAIAMVRIANAEDMTVDLTPAHVGQFINLRLFDGEFEGRPFGEYRAYCCDPKFMVKQQLGAAVGGHLPTLPEYSLDLSGSTQRVVITHFEALTEDFFVQLESDVPVIDELVELLNLLNTSPDGVNSLMPVDSPQIGQICASRFPDTDAPEAMLYRCEVISVDPLMVFYVDYGNTEEAFRLLELPTNEPLFWTPPHAHRCRLIQGAKSLLKNPKQVEDLLQESEARVDLHFKEQLTTEKPLVYMCEVLVPPSVEDEPSGSLFPRYPNLVDGIYSASHISEDGTIWLQTEERSVELINMESFLSEIDETQMVPLSSYAVGKVCIVTSRISDVAVFRAEIIKSDQSTVTVLAIDYGPEETFEMSNINAKLVSLYSIPKSFSRRILDQPRFAIPCRLLDESDAYRRLRLCDFPHVCYFVHFAQSAIGSSLPPFYVDLRPLEDRASTTTPGFRNSHSAQPLAFTFPAVAQTKFLSSNAAATNNAAIFNNNSNANNKPESGFVDSVFDAPDSPNKEFNKESFSNVESSNQTFKPAFSDGSRFRAICVHTASGENENGDVAFFQDEDRSAELDKLFDALSDVSQFGPVNFPDISVGSIVAARYSVDGFWYRAVVLSKPPNRDLGPTVFFIDYGNCDKLKSCTSVDIRQLPSSLSTEAIKPLAIAVRSNDRPIKAPVKFQLDEAYTLEVASSSGYMSGVFAAAAHIPIIVANVIKPASSIASSIASDVSTTSSDLKPKQAEPVAAKQQQVEQPPKPPVEQVVKLQFEQLVKPQPTQPPQQFGLNKKTETTGKSIRYTTAALRKLQQAALPSLPKTITNLAHSLGILRNSVPPALHYQHDNRLLPKPESVASSVTVTKSISSSNYSVRPYLIPQLPKTCATKPFDARVVWISDDAIYVQMETDESVNLLDEIDGLAQSYGPSAARVPPAAAPASLLNKACLCKWIAGDERWYRAVVRNVADLTSSPPTLEVFFVDFGNTDKIPMSDLALLPDAPFFDESNPNRKLLTLPVCSIPIVKGSHNVQVDNVVKVCIELSPVNVRPYSARSLEVVS